MGLLKTAFGVALIGPLAVAAGVIGVRFGLMDWLMGYQTLAMSFGLGAAVVGVIASLGGVIYALGTGRAAAVWLPVLGLLLSGAVVFGVMRQRQAVQANPPVHEASTDWEDRPGFSSDIMRSRTRADAAPLTQTGDPAACPGAVAVPSQMAPEAVRAALEDAGVQVIGVAPYRAEGQRQGFWFGFTQDVVVRIRPGQTDVRVAGREDRPDGGEACRLASRVVAALQVRA
jgi:hypothetical protein